MEAVRERSDHAVTMLQVCGTKIKLMRGGSGPAVLCLHGAGGAPAWLPFMAKLAERFDVIVPEHPGFGESESPDWLDNVHDLAYFYLDAIQALGLDRVHLVGFDLGGWIAAEMAVRNTGRIASLTLVGAAGLYVPGVAQLDSFLRNDEQKIRDLFVDEAQAERMIAETVIPENEDVVLKNSLTTARIVWQPRGYDPHLHKWLHRIDVGTLLVWGDTDRLTPREHAAEYERLIPDARTVIVPDCGHIPQIEKPDAFCAALGGFLADMGART